MRLVFAGGAGGWEWGLVVSIFVDESGTRRVRGGCTGPGGAGLGDLVSEGGEGGDLDSGISG